MGRRATRKTRTGDGIRDLEFDALKAENLHLKEEIERLRLRNAGAHPAAALAEALQSADDAADSADDALTMYASSMVIRGELIELLTMLKATIGDYERRLELLTDTPLLNGSAIHAAEGDDLVDADQTEAVDDGAATDDEQTEPDHGVTTAAAGDTDTDDDRSVDHDDAVVSIDLRDPDRVTATTGTRRNGAKLRRGRDDQTEPAAKGA